MENKIRVGIIFGGRSGEHEVSIMSAMSVMKAIDREKYEVVPIGVTREGIWLTSGDPVKALTSSIESSGAVQATLLGDPALRSGLLVPISDAGVSVEAGRFQELDVVFPLIHGTNGEDGTIQGLLELANVPYVGAGVAASGVGMDKALMKAIFRAEGIPVMDYVTIKRSQWDKDPNEVIAEIHRAFGDSTVFVKPCNLGSSVGISKVSNPSELPAAIEKACRYDRKILVERAAEDCREVECSVLGNDEPIASIPGEIVPCREFYDYEAKYIAEGSELIIPARIPEDTASEVKRLAIRAFQAIDCAGMARVDFFVHKHTQKVIVNEINTIPGFTKISMYPKLWEASGIPYRELIDRLIELAFDRYRDKNRNLTTYSSGGDE